MSSDEDDFEIGMKDIHSNVNNNDTNNNNNNITNEETPLLIKPLNQNFSNQHQHQTQHQTQNNPDATLDTLVDTVRYIIKRDSEITLFQEEEEERKRILPISPWTLDSVVRSPMLSSSPNILSIPNLKKRREDQIKKHHIRREKEKEKKMKEKKRMRRERVTSVGNEHEITNGSGKIGIGNEFGNIGIGNEFGKIGTNNGDNHDLEEDHVTIKNEDEQWERKRREKLTKVILNSASNNSLASSMAYSNSSDKTDGHGQHGHGQKAYTYSPTEDIIKELKKEFAKTKNPVSMSIMYGIINTVIVLPVLMSFGSIIYHDEFFRPYMPVLVKLTVVSGVVHQLSFSTFSTLPFAVGQVQDAGLIFLSTIASSIVKYCKNDGRDDEEILATTLVGLSLFTTMLGVGLVIIGRLKLASYVQLLPTPCVGGYLAFIGFFCGQGGMSLMSNVQVSGILEWYKFAHVKEIMLSLPGIIGGIGIYVSMRTIKHMAVLPCAVASVMMMFYVTLGVTGLSLEDAKGLGWVNQADAPPVWYHTWDYIQFDKVVWAALPGQSLTVLSMIFVVALSSSLDIAAIDLEIPKPLEYNYELRMIGLSNVISGISGGYTGSYIFSQSIFSLRAGIRSPLMGYVIALCEAITIVIPISILSYVPNFVFGSLLMMICVDLMVEWLWDVRKKLTSAEYFVALSTFFLIQLTSVEYGIISGVVLHFILRKLGFDVDNSKDQDQDQNKQIADGGSDIDSDSNSPIFVDSSEVGMISIDKSPQEKQTHVFTGQNGSGSDSSAIMV